MCGSGSPTNGFVNVRLCGDTLSTSTLSYKISGTGTSTICSTTPLRDALLEEEGEMACTLSSSSTTCGMNTSTLLQNMLLQLLWWSDWLDEFNGMGTSAISPIVSGTPTICSSKRSEMSCSEVIRTTSNDSLLDLRHRDIGKLLHDAFTDALLRHKLTRLQDCLLDLRKRRKPPSATRHVHGCAPMTCGMGKHDNAAPRCRKSSGSVERRTWPCACCWGADDKATAIDRCSC